MAEISADLRTRLALLRGSIGLDQDKSLSLARDKAQVDSKDFRIQLMRYEILSMYGE